ncbi:MAG: CPBP family intramembrane glutamic endopeptidase [Cyanobacteria bacterium P01_A01_bin.105]
MAAVSTDDTPTLSKPRLFGILWLMGAAGVFSLLKVPLTIPELLPVSPTLYRPLMLVQPLILLTVMVWLGTTLATRIGFDTPLIRALYEREGGLEVVRSQLVPAATVTLVVFMTLMGLQGLAEPHLPEAYLNVNQSAETLLPPLTRFFYGGITEEILMRWGLMTLLVWLPWKLLQKSMGRPSQGLVWSAIVMAALLFGLGHLPLLFQLVPQASASLALYIVGLNALVGIATGWLYWKRGLEAAMMAHVIFHLLGLVAQGQSFS